MPWLKMLAAVAAVFVLLALLPGRAAIPPLVESDYCYQLIAANRIYEGLGPTALQPVAPLQPWEWQYDWGLLTQWPVGYPLLVAAVRWITGGSAIGAAQWISVTACALALVGWFAWVKRIVPRGVAGLLLAMVAAGCAVAVGMLINPSTDAILVALLPFVLLATSAAMTAARFKSSWLVCAGLLSGGLFWIRYASIFAPAAVSLYLLVEWLVRRRLGGHSAGGGGATAVLIPRGQGAFGFRHVAIFAGCAAGPIVTLLAINHIFGAGSTQTQLNLGSSMGFEFAPSMLTRAWWNFTAFGFYDHHWFSHWLLALWPLVLLVVFVAIPRVRRAAGAFFARPEVLLSVIVAATLLLTLIAAATIFGDKFDYVGLDRYYRPIKPLYFVLFAAPVLLIRRRVVRGVCCLPLLLACLWLVQHEWPHTYRRWLQADREAAPSGEWARCFTPDAASLYGRLRTQAAPDLIVVSNFHEYITFETGIATLPIPPDRSTLNRWIDRIATARAVRNPRVLFVLDPDNRWRDYWIPKPTEITQTFALRDCTPTPVAGASVCEYVPPVSSVATGP